MVFADMSNAISIVSLLSPKVFTYMQISSSICFQASYAKCKVLSHLKKPIQSFEFQDLSDSPTQNSIAVLFAQENAKQFTSIFEDLLFLSMFLATRLHHLTISNMYCIAMRFVSHCSGDRVFVAQFVKCTLSHYLGIWTAVCSNPQAEICRAVRNHQCCCSCLLQCVVYRSDCDSDYQKCCSS